MTLPSSSCSNIGTIFISSTASAGGNIFPCYMLIVAFLLITSRDLHALRQCESDVCLNGGTCEVNDEDRSFRCLCPQGFQGLLCELETACTLKCQNNGQCVFTDAGKQICKCLNEFSGKLCEIGSTDCRVQGCSTGERCVITDKFTSYCAPDPCIPNPCQHNGTCTPVKDTFECTCKRGFESALCANDVDECAHSPCKNNAICVNTLGSFTCLCREGFRGSLCEESTPCDPNPCYNGGICSVLDGIYHCSCQPGFTSELCQERIEEDCNCKSDKQICVNGVCKCPNGFMGKDCDQPVAWSCVRNGGCDNGGTCVQSTGGCLCAPGYTGMRCEHALECTVDGTPCLHGSCIWSANGTICNCEIGFVGKNCEKSVEEADPCKRRYCNAGQCENKEGVAVCICPEGSTGEFCENTVDICSTKPCLNDGECFANLANPTDFNCVCNTRFSGKRCELEVPEVNCVPQCTASETCQQRNGSFICVKAFLLTPVNLSGPTKSDLDASREKCGGDNGCIISHYGGESPSESCQNDCLAVACAGLTRISCDDCVHSLRCIESGEYAVCVCDTSWTGPKCDQRIKECENLACADYQICRNELTAVGTTAVCGCAPGLIGSECTVNTAVTFHATSFFLHQSPHSTIGLPSSDYTLKFTFRTTLLDTHILSAENILSQVQFALSLRRGYLYGNFTGLVYRRILPFAVNDDHWYTVLFNNTNKIVSLEIREGDFVLMRLQMKERKNIGIYWTRIGKGRGDGFKGCIRDLFINGEFVDMLKSSNVFGVTEGCQRSKLCLPNPCQNDGVCYDQWDEFRCDCKKPFLPPYCIQQTDEVTFGHDNIPSMLEFDTGRNLEDIKLDTDIDFLLRTNKPNGALLYLGEKNSDDVGTFIALEIVNGTLKVRTRLGGKRVYSRSVSGTTDDNKVHLINLIRDRNNFTISIDGTEQTKFDVENRFDHPLLADSLVLGNSEYLPADAFSTNDFFKGSLQDLRINDRVVPFTILPADIDAQQFGTRVREENVLQGTISDDICSLLKPCVNGGKCSNTFNDFECECEYSWTGKRCNERDHCALASCGTNVTCTNYNGGYVCSSPATFIPTSFAKYKLMNGVAKGSSKLSQISFLLRTRSTFGQIMYLKTPSSFISVLLKDGLLVCEALVDGSVKKRSTNFAVNDGAMHSIDINENGLLIDGKLSRKKSVPLPSNIFEISGNISLTAGQRNSETPSFDGCLEDLQIGTTPPISFFGLDQSGGFLENVTYFELVKRRNILDKQCYAEDLCSAAVNPCKNGALCRDLWNARQCECQPGFTGTFCELRINNCENHTCKFGSCVNDISGYSCQCLPGYSGQFCNEKIDLCKTLPCLNGGNCTSDAGRYTCSCGTQFVGSRCQTLRTSKCNSVPCENGARCTDTEDTFKCDCPQGFYGDVCDEQMNFCEGNPCKNGATCLSRDYDFECLCTNGYEGRTCDQTKDYCLALPCMHGECRTVSGDFLCDCEPGWKGFRCDVDIDECIRFPCEHDGNCTNSPGSYHCSCDSYHLGDRCEVVGSCVQEPCGPGGDCIQKTATAHMCVCRRGYTGDACDIMIDYCSPDPCQNGATCERFIGGFSCLCLAGFTGETCSVDIDDCVGDVCLNGGRCIDRINGYDCDCEGTGYQGTHCTDDIDECLLGICVYGSCSNTIGSYNCSCNEGYIGQQCNIEDPCIPDSLNRTKHDCVHGTCKNPSVSKQNGREVANYECECEPGYGGEHCIHMTEKRKSIPFSYVAGPAAALVAALLIIGCVLFAIVVVRGRRAMQGTYSPSHQESSAARMPMNSVLKSPPEERLI